MDALVEAVLKELLLDVALIGKYFASVDFLHEGDLFRQWDNNRGYKAGYGFNRINVRSNLDFKLTKTTLLKANISGSHGVKQGPWNIAANSWAETQLWQAAYSAPSDCFLPRYSDGTWGYYPADTQGAPNSVVNLAISGVGKITKTRINTDFTLEQDLGFTPVRDKDLLRKVPISYSFQCARAVPLAYSRRNSMQPMPHRDS